MRKLYIVTFADDYEIEVMALDKQNSIDTAFEMCLFTDNTLNGSYEIYNVELINE